VTGRNLSGTKLERSSVSGAATSGLLYMAVVGGAVLALLAAASHAAH
jgi:fucose permease